jgi:hypothetical protein
MSALELVDALCMSRELLNWQLWAARKVCDCEALSRLTGDELADADRHRVDCRYCVLAADMADEEVDRDPTPWCSYGHRTRAQCDCGPIADNE